MITTKDIVNSDQEEFRLTREDVDYILEDIEPRIEDLEGLDGSIHNQTHYNFLVQLKEKLDKIKEL